MATSEEKIGKTIIRWQANKDGSFSGTTILGTKRGEILSDGDEARLKQRLRVEAGKLHPHYFGMDGAIARFLQFMPGAFEGERNFREERDYKVKAHKALTTVLPQHRAEQASGDDALKVRAAPVWINLLSPYESMHLKEAMEGPNGAAFLRAAAQFAGGDLGGGAEGMRKAMKAHGALTWPIATYFPFLWDPARHMFLKPEVTRDFAERIGHPFQYDYASDIRADVYQSLLELTEQSRLALASLKPRDHIDVQSFIFVIGGYADTDKAEV